MTHPTIAYDVADYDPNTGRLLLSTSDHWLVLDPIPGEPIRMTRFDDETAARAAFTNQEDTP